MRLSRSMRAKRAMKRMQPVFHQTMTMKTMKMIQIPSLMWKTKVMMTKMKTMAWTTEWMK